MAGGEAGVDEAGALALGAGSAAGEFSAASGDSSSIAGELGEDSAADGTVGAEGLGD